MTCRAGHVSCHSDAFLSFRAAHSVIPSEARNLEQKAVAEPGTVLQILHFAYGSVYGDKECHSERSEESDTGTRG